MELIVSRENDVYQARWGAQRWRCAVGRSGITTTKREGDGATPLGAWPMRRLLYRDDRLKRPETALPCQAIRADDGWCDAPQDPAYNQPVRLPYPASHEVLRRDDLVYDLLVVLGYNDAPVVPNLGSAIFLHLAHSDYSGTEGCVALARADLLSVLAGAAPGDVVRVLGEPA